MWAVCVWDSRKWTKMCVRVCVWVCVCVCECVCACVCVCAKVTTYVYVELCLCMTFCWRFKGTIVLNQWDHTAACMNWVPYSCYRLVSLFKHTPLSHDTTHAPSITIVFILVWNFNDEIIKLVNFIWVSVMGRGLHTCSLPLYMVTWITCNSIVWLGISCFVYQ